LIKMYPPMTARYIRFAVGTAAAACVLGITLLIYWSGIQGGTFHFDDAANLSALGTFGVVDSVAKLFDFLSSGIAGPSGRPLALLSFLADGQSWPTDPRPFLRTNTIIHALNGLLVFLVGWLLLKHSNRADLSRHATGIGALSAFLWLLHPYWVSSVLYAVQRMTLLSAMFCFAGLALYLYGRALTLEESTRRTGWWLATVGVGLGTGLGVLAKENAAVLPLLILVIELIGIRSMWPVSSPTRFERIWSFFVLILPTFALIAYLLHTVSWSGFFATGGFRPFSTYERLVTEPTILIGYLRDLFIPQPGYPGLFQENYPFARGLLSPPSALVGVLLIVALFVFAIWKRRQTPLFSLAILFFFAGHLIESSVIMLELKFEHRNYLPAALLFLPLAAVIVRSAPRLRWALASLLIVTLAGFTALHAALWGRPLELTLYWAQKNPDSYRAQIAAASRLDRSGQKETALEILRRATVRHPDSAALWLAYTGFLQSAGDTENARLAANAAVQAIRTGPFDLHANEILDPLIDDDLSKGSSSLPGQIMAEIVSAFENRTEYNQTLRDHGTYVYARAKVALSDGNIAVACKHLLALQKMSGRIGSDLQIFALLASKGYYADARYFLRAAEKKITLVPDAGLRFPPDWYRKEIERLDRTLKDDERATGGNPVAICGADPGA
jgi:protein O-mannosyl-transferase